MPFLQVKDEFSWICGVRVLNYRFVSLLAVLQVGVAAVSLSQHIYSLIMYQHIFFCKFVTKQSSLDKTLFIMDSPKSNETDAFLKNDVIIFDFYLFHTLIPAVTKCIANYLDGGYMRCLWCLWQLASLLMLLVVPYLPRTPHPLYMYPILIMQNSYCFGLVVLSIATADKMAVALLAATRDTSLTGLIMVYYAGTAVNYMLCYVLWHYYWHLEALYKQEHPRCRQTWL